MRCVHGRLFIALTLPLATAWAVDAEPAVLATPRRRVSAAELRQAAGIDKPQGGADTPAPAAPESEPARVNLNPSAQELFLRRFVGRWEGTEVMRRTDSWGKQTEYTPWRIVAEAKLGNTSEGPRLVVTATVTVPGKDGKPIVTRERWGAQPHGDGLAFVSYPDEKSPPSLIPVRYDAGRGFSYQQSRTTDKGTAEVIWRHSLKPEDGADTWVYESQLTNTGKQVFGLMDDRPEVILNQRRLRKVY